MALVGEAVAETGGGAAPAPVAAGRPADGTVGKALGLLDAVAAAGRPVRFGELAGASGLPKATLHRLLQTLVSQGMLAHEPADHTYRLGLRLVRLAHAAWAQSSLAPAARPALDRLAQETRLTVHLAQLDAGHVLYVDKRSAARPVEMFSQAGKVGPAYCTGVGKAMLSTLGPDDLEAALQRQAFHAFTPATLTSPAALRADLVAIRASGLAFDREEHEPGIICAAAPVLGRGGRLLGAVSVTAPTDRHGLADLERLGPQLRAAAADIARAAEAWLFPAPGGAAARGEAGPCPA